MGREAVGSLFNYLAHCNLDLNIDVNDLLQKIAFQRNQDGLSVPLKPLPYHPIRDANHIALWRGYYQHYRNQCLSIYIPINRMAYKRLRDEMLEESTAANTQIVFDLTERQSLTTPIPVSSHVQIEEVISRKVEAGKVHVDSCFLLYIYAHIYIRYLGIFCCKTVWPVRYNPVRRIYVC
jgi:hypothetical protein